MPPHAVQADGLIHRYRQTLALSDVALTLDPGIVGLVGVNGAGKSTLIRILSTALVPVSGRLSVFGLDAMTLGRQTRRRIGYMPQDLTIPKSLRVDEFLAYVAWARGFGRKGRTDLVDEALEAADLTKRARSRVGELSGGMFRRLLLGQALLGSPDLLLLDEPTGGLDPEQRVRVRELVAAGPASRTTLVSSHQMEDLAPIADRIVMLDAGRIIFDDSAQRWRERGESLISPISGISPYEAAFLQLRAGPAS
ncbi:ATP-binding cassette domain-containing protein [Nocardioides sp. R1-1]|uniref:ATP-binding cassette domain-containing protein n=1 Tax=Nocardioides sp. R1-1 TaxID=3383502 RepID=UPI0038CFEE5F